MKLSYIQRLASERQPTSVRRLHLGAQHLQPLGGGGDGAVHRQRVLSRRPSPLGPPPPRRRRPPPRRPEGAGRASAGRYEADVDGERPADGQIADERRLWRGRCARIGAGTALTAAATASIENIQLPLDVFAAGVRGWCLGYERMRTMPDDTTQRCHRLAPQDRRPRRRPVGPRSGRSIPPIRSDLVGEADTLLAATQPARPILAYPPCTFFEH